MTSVVQLGSNNSTPRDNYATTCNHLHHVVPPLTMDCVQLKVQHNLAHPHSRLYCLAALLW